MSERLSKGDYDVLDRYMRAVLKRHGEGKSDLVEAHEDIMHPLTAWDKRNAQEFIPYMKLMLEKWGR